jgi:hypothetical protein
MGVPPRVAPHGAGVVRAVGVRFRDGRDREHRPAAGPDPNDLAAAVRRGDHVGQHLAAGGPPARGPAASGSRRLRTGQPAGRRDARPVGRDDDEQRHQGHDEGARHQRYRRVQPDHPADGPGRRLDQQEP